MAGRRPQPVLFCLLSLLAVNTLVGDEQRVVQFMDDVSPTRQASVCLEADEPFDVAPMIEEGHPRQDAVMTLRERHLIRRLPVLHGEPAARDNRLEPQTTVQSAETNQAHLSDEGGEPSIDAAAKTLSLIAIDKVFTRSKLLEDTKPGGALRTECLTDFRDPYLGFARTTTFNWVASNLAHKTLYFEDDPLERYGYTCSPLLQPAISAGEFAKDIIAAPIRGIFDGPCKCHFVTGRPRTGSCVCHLKERLVPER